MLSIINIECKCKFDDRKCDWNQKRNNDKYLQIYKNQNEHSVCKEYYIYNSARCSCENDKYLAIFLAIQWLRVMKL